MKSNMDDVKAIKAVQASTLADVKPPEFLWYPYLVNNDLNLLIAEPTWARNLFVQKLIADLSAGKALPGLTAENSNKITVLYLNIMDDCSYVATGIKNHDGILKNVYFSETADAAFLGKDMNLLEKLLVKLKPQLLIIDYWTCFTDPKSDITAPTIRHWFMQLRLLAQRVNCCILVGDFVRKLTSQTVGANRNLEIVNVCRSVLYFVGQPENQSAVLVHTKSNFAPLGKSVACKIVDDCLQWDGFSELNGQGLFD